MTNETMDGDEGMGKKLLGLYSFAWLARFNVDENLRKLETRARFSGIDGSV